METQNSNSSLVEILNLQRRGENWEAMKRLKEITQAQPTDAIYYKLLGNIYFHMGLLDWAIDYYKDAIKLDSDFIDAHYDLGVSYYHRGKVTQAIAEFLNVLKLDPDYHAAHYRIGLCYKHAGKYNAAIHHLLESTVVTPEYVMAYYHLGELYYEQGDLEKAKVSFQRILNEDPDDEATKRYLKIIAEKI